jgi:acetate kinase
MRTAAKNAKPDLDQNIAAAGSNVQVLVIRADEDWEIARECQRLAGAYDRLLTCAVQ